MQVVYIILCILIIWEVVRSRIDYVSIAAGSFLLYSSNCIIGRVWVPQSGYFAYYASIDLETYLLICTQMLIILLFLHMKRRGIRLVFGKKNTEYADKIAPLNGIGTANGNKIYWIAILLVSIGSIIYSLVFEVGFSTFFSYITKADILEGTSFLFSLSIWGGLICFFHFYLTKRKIGTIVSAMIILISVLLGSRAYIASALVGILIIKSFGWNQKSKNDIDTKRNTHIIVLAVIMLLFLILYKLIYKEIRAGDFASALNVLTNPETWTNLFDIDELRIVCANYNYTIENQIHLPMIDVIARFVSFIPFVNDFVPTEYPIRFSTILKEGMNTTYGLGSNFWGETYAMGGGVFLLLLTIVWIIFINRLNEKAKASKSPFIITVVSYLSFYIHRLDWTQVMGCFKLVLIFYLIKVIFDLVFIRHNNRNFRVSSWQGKEVSQ